VENLCYLIGVAAQFARSSKNVPDWAVLVGTLVLSVLAYWLATPDANWADRAMYLAAIEWWKTTLAGTLLTRWGRRVRRSWASPERIS
jgi:hypothetical protein